VALYPVELAPVQQSRRAATEPAPDSCQSALRRCVRPRPCRLRRRPSGCGLFPWANHCAVGRQQEAAAAVACILDRPKTRHGDTPQEARTDRARCSRCGKLFRGPNPSACSSHHGPCAYGASERCRCGAEGHSRFAAACLPPQLVGWREDTWFASASHLPRTHHSPLPTHHPPLTSHPLARGETSRRTQAQASLA